MVCDIYRSPVLWCLTQTKTTATPNIKAAIEIVAQPAATPAEDEKQISESITQQKRGGYLT